jgi:hypothetical protein
MAVPNGTIIIINGNRKRLVQLVPVLASVSALRAIGLVIPL